MQNNQNNNMNAYNSSQRTQKKSSVFTLMLLTFGSFAFVFLLIVTVLLSFLFVQNNPKILSDLNGFSKNNQDSESDGSNLSNEAKEVLSDTVSDDVYEAEGTIVELAEKLSPAVTTVVVKSQNFSLDTFSIEEQSQGSGTGFFISSSGLLITNEHVVCGVEDPSNIVVVTSSGDEYRVKRFDTDPFQDLAILEVDVEGKTIDHLEFANQESELKTGQEVIAIGNPFGSNPNSVTRGIISGLNRNIQASGSCGSNGSGTDIKFYEGVLQTDAAINFGNSGGPLINLKGEVIGVNSATSSDANNVSYAIPFDRVYRLVERYLENDGKIKFPFLGVRAPMIDPAVATSREIPLGAIVEAVEPNSAAEKAGIQQYDIISKVNEYDVDFSLTATITQHFNPGETVELEVFRRKDSINTLDLGNNSQRVQLIYPDEPIKVKVTLGEREL